MSNFQITPAHAAIFDAIRDPAGGNVIVSAVAGAGKTTTLIECLRIVQDTHGVDARVAFVAFGKRIVEELIPRVPHGVDVMTLNSMGFRALGSHLRAQGISVKVDGNKLRSVAREVMDEASFRRFGAVAVKLARLGKASGLIPYSDAGLVPDTRITWAALREHHDLEVPEGVEDHVVDEAASLISRKSFETLTTVDFDDQLLLTYALTCPMQRFDWLFVDEAQDLSPLQHALVARALGPNGRLVACGDENQAIFGFRGADSSSMDTLAAKFACKRLPLHVSYRCPRTVVAVAQRYVQHIKAHEAAPEGVVDESMEDFDNVQCGPGDMVVCRFNAPAVRAAYSLIARGIPAVILGRDVASGLISLVDKLDAGSLEDFLRRLTKWENDEITKAMKRDDEGKADRARDKAETLRVFAAMVDEIAQLVPRINDMFSDASPANVVTCCTIHKAKGLEAERVVVIDLGMGSQRAKKPWMQQQEKNLCYVAVTRAKRELILSTVDTRKKLSATGIRPVAAAPAKEERVYLTGNTFPVKDHLKVMGGRWDPDRKQWHVPADARDAARRLHGVRLDEPPLPRKITVRQPVTEPLPPKPPRREMTDADWEDL